MFLLYWIVNNREFCIWAPIVWTVTFLKISPIFREMMSMNFWSLIKIVQAVFEKIAILFWGSIWRVPVLGARLLIFTTYWRVIDELLNTKFELNLSTCLGISPPPPHTHTHTHTRTTFAYSEGLKTNCQYLKISVSSEMVTVFHHTYLLHTIWEIKKKIFGLCYVHLFSTFVDISICKIALGFVFGLYNL
jgi:hypothetical protein